MSATTDWPELHTLIDKLADHYEHEHPDPDMHECKYADDVEAEIVQLIETYIRTHQLDLVDQFRDHIDGAYEAVEMAMGEAYYQITQADKKGNDNE